MGCKDYCDQVWGFECTELLVNKKYDARNPWHAVYSNLIKLSPMGECD